MNIESKILDSNGDPYTKSNSPTQTPDFDPDFLRSFKQLRNSSDAQLKALLSKPYARQPWVYACASTISGTIASLPVVLKDEKGDEQPITNHEAVEFFENPNTVQTGSQFMETIVLNLLLPTSKTEGGQCFLVPLDSAGKKMSLMSGKIPDTMFPFTDENIDPVVHKGTFIGWLQRVAGTSIEIFYKPEEILRINLVNPYNLLRGLSPLSAAMTSIASDAKAVQLSDNFMTNSASIGGHLTTEQKLSEKQRNLLVRSWQEGYGGSDKAGLTPVLHSGLVYEQNSKSLKDLQFTDQRNMSRDEILAVYKCSKFILGLSDDVNRATAEAEEEVYWKRTILPLTERIWEPINSQWIKWFRNGKFKAMFDLSNVAALQENLSSKIDDANKLIDKGVTPENAYRIFKIPVDIDSQPWLKEPWVKPPLVNLRTGELSGFGNVEGQLSVNPSRSKEFGRTIVEERKNIKLLNSEKDAFWVAWVKETLDPVERHAIPEVKRFFEEQKERFLDKLSEWVENAKSQDLGTIRVKQSEGLGLNDIFLSEKAETEKLKEIFSGIYEDEVELQRRAMGRELGGIQEFTVDSPAVKLIIEQRMEFLKKLNSNTFKLLREEITKVINDGLVNDLSIAELSKNIAAIEEGIFSKRINNAKTIARTEVSSIASRIRVEILDAEGVPLKDWVTAGDEKVRHTHQVSGRSKPLEKGERFPGSGLLYPLEFGGPPEEVINCRCTVVGAF